MKKTPTPEERVDAIKYLIEVAAKARDTAAACIEEGNDRATTARGRQAVDLFYDTMFKIKQWAEGIYPNESNCQGKR